MQRQHTLFLLKFFAILVVSYLFIAWNPINDHMIVPFTRALTRSAAAILNVIGQKVTVTDTIISSSRFAVNINNGCNGVEAMLILLASMAAFPAPIRSRVNGILLGALVVQLLNEVRIVSLFLLGAYHPRIFQLFHTAVWQIAIILVAVLYFLFWSSRLAPNRLANRA